MKKTAQTEGCATAGNLELVSYWLFPLIVYVLGSFTFLSIQYEQRWAALLPTAKTLQMSDKLKFVASYLRTIKAERQFRRCSIGSKRHL
jgi:hypothetical protein